MVYYLSFFIYNEKKFIYFDIYFFSPKNKKIALEKLQNLKKSQRQKLYLRTNPLIFLILLTSKNHVTRLKSGKNRARSKKKNLKQKLNLNQNQRRQKLRRKLKHRKNHLLFCPNFPAPKNR